MIKRIKSSPKMTLDIVPPFWGSLGKMNEADNE